ncbi:unnamed protein product [Oncorhynchus mykiss]|uniref:REM-1 domain-containing protein n=1 Tax=Oncorhynchus mykiss TaxID=8022 RepID=A0A060ZEK2_ONCMY|nr:unnamed protein product [Oncorhynchus mykiss]
MLCFSKLRINHNLSYNPPLSLQGCDPCSQTQRSKLQHRRARINQQINKEMRMRAGAENLFR